MSTALNEASAKSLSSLLAEYTKKIGDMSAHAKALRKSWINSEPDQRQFILDLASANDDRLRWLHGQFTSLAQEASQWVEHGELDDPARLELKVRLADFEAQLRYTTRVMEAVKREMSRS